MIQSPAPPDTSGPYHAAYTIVAIVYAAYAISIWWRSRKVQRRLHGLDAGVDRRP